MHAAPGTNPEALWHTVQLPWNDTDALTRFFADRGAEVAAVICEPICANAGVVHPLPGFLAQLAQLAADNGALVVFDEVITGFRVSRGGAQELLGIRPDISIISKVLGGGFPVAAFGASREIMDPLARNEAFHGGVYSGNHAAVQAVVSMLGKIQRSPSVYTDLEESCSHLEKKLRDSFAEAGRHVRIARAGSVMSVAVLSGPQTGLEAYDAAMDAIDFAAHRRFQGHCQRGGLYFHPNPLEPWFLSSAHSREDRSDCGCGRTRSAGLGGVDRPTKPAAMAPCSVADQETPPARAPSIITVAQPVGEQPGAGTPAPASPTGRGRGLGRSETRQWSS